MIVTVFGEFQNEKVAQFYVDRLRTLTIEQRWRIVAEMRQVAINMVRAEVRAQHPDWAEVKVKGETTRRIMAAHGFEFDPNRRHPARA